MVGYPPAIINPKERLTYIASLETAQTGGTKELYEKIIFTAARRSLDIYLKSVMGKNIAEPEESGKLLKIGQLAKIAGETVATIRFWTNEGLLEVADITDSNYHLYSHEMVKICQKIQNFKKQRLTLEEVKKLMAKTI